MPFQATRGRPKSLDPQPSYHLPPNVYNIKSSTEQLISKRTSKRGPYDLFTGELICTIYIKAALFYGIQFLYLFKSTSNCTEGLD